MKLYDFTAAPNPRRARMFMAEKQLDIDTVQIDLTKGEQFSEAFRAINPGCTVPALVLDDGMVLTENLAIAVYLEATHPEPPLMGGTPAEKATIAMWQARIEFAGLAGVAESFRNQSSLFVDRSLPGPGKHAQIPELVTRGRARAEAFFQMLDQRLAEHEFICGECFSLADITALVTVDFADWIKLNISTEQAHLKRWYDAVSSRPSAEA